MGAFLQIGHEGWNLLNEPISFRGIVLSPVNDSPSQTAERLQRLGDRRGQLDVVFDPQLYNPTSSRGQLPNWSYFPADLDTADMSNLNWWFGINQRLVACAVQLQSNVVCSPAHVPRTYSADYYAAARDIADDLTARASTAGMETAATLIVRLSDLLVAQRAPEIASIISATRASRLYIVFVADGVEPRQQIVDTQLLATAVHLVRLLAEHLRVHIAFSAQDLVLWKAAGAHDVSTGKFLNLRRFSPARWTDDQEEGGRVVPYWSEPSLLTLIRDADVLTLASRGLYSDGIQLAANPYSQRILNILTSGSGDPWVALAWRQYLHWFVGAEARLASGEAALAEIDYAIRTWAWLADQQVLLLDHWNDGSWVRAWHNAAYEGMSR